MAADPKAERLAAVRDARKARDQARDRLYALQLRRLELERAALGQKRGHRSTDPEMAKERAALEARQADLAAQLDAIAAQLKDLDGLPGRIAKARAGLADLEKSAQAQADAARALAAKLAADAPARKAPVSPELNPTVAALRKAQSQRAALAGDAEILRRKLADLQQQEAAAEMTADGLRVTGRKLQAALDETRAQLAALTAAPPADLAEQAGRQRKEVAAARAALADAEAGVRAALATLFGNRKPSDLITDWDDGLPILLLPLRLETRWRTTAAKTELWVRVYPDDVAVTTHEKVLTDAEVEHGRGYWTNRRAPADDAARADAWRKLAARLGANRAAWVARQNKPANWDAAQADAALVLAFPQPEITKADSWTTAPHTRVLPDRFVLLGWRGGALKLEDLGAPIADIVVLGPSPVGEDEQATITRDQLDKKIRIGPAFAWVREFEAAKTAGMAFQVDVTDPDVIANGLDELIVLGIKTSAQPADAQALIEELIDNHHYARPGFSLVRQGTPTNNTDGNDSGYTVGGRSGDESAIEVGPDAFVPLQDRAQASDGQRLADFLGISYDPLLHADGADLTDAADAIAMNRALQAGTLGYTLDHMLNEVVDDTALDAVRRHFNELVTGRGPIAAIRVGAQPYGVLPTSAFKLWQPTTQFDDHPRKVDTFEATLHALLLKLDDAWSRATPRRLGSPASKDGGAGNLLEVLGLQPTSAEFYQRVAYSYDTLKNMESLVWGGQELADVLGMIIEGMAGRAFLQQLGYKGQRADGTDKPLPLLFQLIWRHTQTQLDPRQLIDGQPLSESATIKPYDPQTGDNYIDWLLAHAADADALAAQDFGDSVPRPSFVLYMMLYFAMTMAAGRGLRSYLAANGVLADELVRSRKFLNVGAQPSPSPWEVYRAPANAIIGAAAPARPLLDVIHSPQLAATAGAGVAEQRAAMQALRRMSTARLERALVEHMDVLAYRLDAWQTSLFARRLHRQRGLDGAPADRRTGVQLGAYGYLRNVKAAPGSRQAVGDDTLPPELRAGNGAGSLFEQTGNGGYVHAPSLNHAAAAAILRNGYLTHAKPNADPTEAGTLAVNLSSARVRRARYLLDGVRNGQSLETLLGVQFERGLHDWTTRSNPPVILDQLKPVFRAAFPILRTRIPQAADAADGAAPATVEQDYSVVNGLTLAQTTGDFPWGVAELDGLKDTEKAALRQEKNGIANTLDALRDLLTAEAAYQLALGNFDRAAAVVQCVGDGTVPPDIEVIRTPRAAAVSFTNRLAVHLSTAAGPNPWPADPASSQRALLEPGLNRWLGALIPNPADIKCRVQAAATAGGPPFADGAVALSDLGLQPIDFVFMARSQPQQHSIAELEARVRYAFAAAKGVGDDAIVTITLTDGVVDGARPLGEVLPLAERLRRLVGGCRPLDARHFQSASQDTPTPADNPGLIDVAELRGRVGDRLAALRLLFRNPAPLPAVTPLEKACADALPDGASAAKVGALRDAIKRIADAGFDSSFPVSSAGADAAARAALVNQAHSLLVRFDALAADTDARLADIDGTAQPAPRKLERLTEIVKAWLGGDALLLPRFSFLDAAAVTAAHAASDALTATARAAGMARPVDEWLHGAACVRPRVHDFEMVRTMAEAALDEPLALAPIQLPYRAGDRWLGVEFGDMEVVHDTAGIVRHLPAGFVFDAAGAQSGLVVDEWTESTPERDTVTGLSFNFNAPNSEPPQALLLAVTPKETGRWRWDDLVETVRDTFRRVQLRAVEPDQLGDMAAIGTLLPLLVAEFTTGKGSVSLDYRESLPAVQAQVLAQIGDPAARIGGE